MTERMTPEVRFEGFEDEWEEGRLNDVVSRITRKNQDLTSSNPLTISAQEGLISQLKYYDWQVASKNLTNYYLLYNGDFAYNKSYSNGYPFGAVKRLENYDKGVLSTLYIVFRPEEISSNFLKHYYESTYWYSSIYEIADEGARNHGLLNVKPTEFFNTRIKYPVDRIEQEKIGRQLEKIEGTISEQKTNLEKLKNLKQAMLRKMFPKEGEKEPEIRFEGFSGEWKKDNLESVARIYQPRTLARDKLNDGPYPVYGANGYIGSHDEYNHQEDQVVISCRGENSGTVNFVQSYTWITGNSMVVNIDNNHELLKRFLFYLLSAQNLKYLVTGSGQPQITRTGVLNHQIFVPTKQEQIIISKFFRNLDTKIELEEENLEKLKQFKKAMLQKMFV